MCVQRNSGPNVFRRGFTLVELLVVIAIIGILVALLLPAIQAAREAARRTQCQNNMHNVALAVLNYESQVKSFPMGTQFPNLPANGIVPSIHSRTDFGESWTISILPYLENQALYDSFIFKDAAGAPVATQHNDNFDERGTVLPGMLCPSDPNNQVKYQGGPGGPNWARGNYAANVGTGAMYPGDGPYPQSPYYINGPGSKGWAHWASRGVMGPNVSVAIKQITDGTSKTMMLGEIRAGVHEGDPRGSWAFGHAGGNLLAFFGWGGDDNGPNYCGPNSDDIGGAPQLNCQDPVLITECMTCFGPGSFDQATSRGVHMGGVMVAMCDGSVTFISDDVETSGTFGGCCRVWDHLVMSSDGGALSALSGGRPGRP